MTERCQLLWRRWLIFNVVGAIGIGVQLATLMALTQGAGLHFLLATALAVETAVLHNFVWHERWTWSDRAARDRSGRWKRLWRFHATNGAFSIAGNVAMMQVLVGLWAMNQTLANLVAIAVCSTLNFFASDHLVFPRTHAR